MWRHYRSSIVAPIPSIDFYMKGVWLYHPAHRDKLLVAPRLLVLMRCWIYSGLLSFRTMCYVGIVTIGSWL